jgi:type IV secretion system protein VirD4
VSLILGWKQQEPVGFGFTATTPAESGELVMDDGTHLIGIAGTGKGKGRSLAIPNLLHSGNDGSCICLDLKGELAIVSARYRRDVLGHEIVVLDPWRRTGFESSSFNPADVIGRGPEMADDCYQLASLLSPPPTGATVNETFWVERGESAIAGVMAHVLTDPDENSRTLARVHEYLSGSDPIYKLAVLLDQQEAQRAAGQEPTMPRFAYQQIASLLQAPDITRGGIQSTALSHLRVFSGELVQAATTTTTFDLAKIVRGDPVTVYIVVPPECLQSHAPLLKLWISAFLTLIFRRKAAPAKPTLLLLDELAALGPMQQVKAAVTLTRAYGVRVAMFLQSYSQLVSMFPLDHQTVFDNCDTVVTMGLPRHATAAAMAAALGDVSAEALAGLRPHEVAVKTTGKPTRILRRLDYLDDALFVGRADRNPIYANQRNAGLPR